MHVRIAWEILSHQKKENSDKSGTSTLSLKPSDMHRPPSHIFPSANVLPRPHELSSTFPAGLPGRPAYEASQLAAGFLAGPTSHLGIENYSITYCFIRLDNLLPLIYFLLNYLYLQEVYHSVDMDRLLVPIRAYLHLPEKYQCNLWICGEGKFSIEKYGFRLTKIL